MAQTYITSDGKRFRKLSAARSHVRRVSDTKGYGLSIRIEDYAKQPKARRNMAKKAKAPSKRVGAALTRFLRKLNPGKMKGVSNVRIKKLKGGGVTITPLHGIPVRRRRRTKKRRK